MVNVGAVFHDPDFQFLDGERGNKLFIVLAVIDQIYTVARTTSKPAGKSRCYGCHLDDRFPNFFIPQEAGLFRHDTWVCLDYLVDFRSSEFQQKQHPGKINQINMLSHGLLLALLECAINSDDITTMQEKRLQIAFEQAKTAR